MENQEHGAKTLVEEAEEELTLAIAGTWPVVLFTGIMTLALGIVVIVWPGETLTVLSVLLGIHLLAFGLFRLISAFSARTIAPGFAGFVGILSMIAGVIVVRNPFETVAVLATVLGVVWIVGGSIDVISSMTDRYLRDRGWTAFMGVVSIAAGVVVVAWPSPTVTAIAWIGGIYLVAFGVMLAIGSFRLKSLER